MQHAPLPLQDAVDRVLQNLRSRATADENRLTSFARPDGPFVSSSPRAPLDVFALLWNLLSELIEKGLKVHLKSACGNGLPIAERSPRVAKLRTKLATLLDEEESLVIDLLTRDFVVERRVPESADDIERLLRVWNRTAAQTRSGCSPVTG